MDLELDGIGEAAGAAAGAASELAGNVVVGLLDVGSKILASNSGGGSSGNNHPTRQKI